MCIAQTFFDERKNKYLPKLSIYLARIHGRSHIVAWGGRGPCNFFFFPLDYEEKKERSPQHSTAGPPPHPFLTNSPSPQSKIKNTIKLKKKNLSVLLSSKKKKKTQKKFELKSEKKNIHI